MPTKIIMFAIVCLVFVGCVNSATRTALDPGEGEFSYTHEITKDQISAYYSAEEWLSSTIKDANTSITLRQPNTGTLVANMYTPVPVGMINMMCGYTIKLVCKGNQVTAKYKLGSMDNGAYPPKNAMPDLKMKFMALILSLKEYIDIN